MRGKGRKEGRQEEGGKRWGKNADETGKESEEMGIDIEQETAAHTAFKVYLIVFRKF